MQQAENSTLRFKVNLILAALEFDKTDLANQIGCDRTTVMKVLSGERKTKRVQQKIVGAICQRVENLFVETSQTDVQTQA